MRRGHAPATHPGRDEGLLERFKEESKAPFAWDGRIEPVVSEQMMHVHSLEALMACLCRVLAGVQPP
jgi:hypothetical protein